MIQEFVSRGDAGDAGMVKWVYLSLAAATEARSAASSWPHELLMGAPMSRCTIMFFHTPHHVI